MPGDPAGRETPSVEAGQQTDPDLTTADDTAERRHPVAIAGAWLAGPFAPRRCAVLRPTRPVDRTCRHPFQLLLYRMGTGILGRGRHRAANPRHPATPGQPRRGAWRGGRSRPRTRAAPSSGARPWHRRRPRSRQVRAPRLSKAGALRIPGHRPACRQSRDSPRRRPSGRRSRSARSSALAGTRVRRRRPPCGGIRAC